MCHFEAHDERNTLGSRNQEKNARVGSFLPRTVGLQETQHFFGITVGEITGIVIYDKICSKMHQNYAILDIFSTGPTISIFKGILLIEKIHQYREDSRMLHNGAPK